MPHRFTGEDEDDQDEDGEDEEGEEEEDDEDAEEEENQRRYDFRQRKTVVRYQASQEGVMNK